MFCLAVCHRTRPCLKRIQPMPNVPLAYASVYRRMSDIFHTLAYASTIRNSVTGPLVFDIEDYDFMNLSAVLIAHWSSLYLYKESKWILSVYFVCVAMCQGDEFKYVLWDMPIVIIRYNILYRVSQKKRKLLKSLLLKFECPSKQLNVMMRKILTRCMY
jgi:hypothetical protein